MFDKEVMQIVKRLQEARLSLMKKQPFYAVLLLHMQFSLDPMCETAYTDGSRIVFCPEFMNTLSDEELEFVLMHEVMHAALNHCSRNQDDYDFDDYNTACDIVVNSNILYSFGMNLSRITLRDYGESMHIAPDGKEGYEYSVEEVYKLIQAQKETEKEQEKGRKKNQKNSNDPEENGENASSQARSDGGFDDHTYWEGEEDEAEDDEMREVWLQRMVEATTIADRMISMDEKHNGWGRMPLIAQRTLKELTQSQTDWRTVLDTFVQEEVTDYSFNPPDRRFQDSMFLLPDYNEKDEKIKNILFMVDTSGSMTDEMITQAYSEIYGAIQQFNGNLQGWLGFFNACVVKPQEFSDEEEFRIIRPSGSGGTSFLSIFEYVRDHLDEIRPESIVILTDGYADWPEEDAAMGIPVLWLINNEEAEPPWGKVARIRLDK